MRGDIKEKKTERTETEIKRDENKPKKRKKRKRKFESDCLVGNPSSRLQRLQCVSE